MHLWSYSDLNERARLRAELAKNARWTGEYVALIRPFLARQEVRLLNAIKPPVAPASTGNIYELRNYRARPLAAREWIAAFTAALPAREKYSKIVGLWQTETGQPNEVCHIWAYPSLNARAEARAQRVERSGVEGISRQGAGVPGRDALDHHAARAAFAAAVRWASYRKLELLREDQTRSCTRRQEGGYWTSKCPPFPACATQGDNVEELMENLREAIEGCSQPFRHARMRRTPHRAASSPF